MAHPYPRHVRVASIVQKIVAPALQRTLPNALITVLQVEVSKDLSVATVHYAVIGAQAGDAALLLENKTAELRTLLAKSMRTKRVPKLVFAHVRQDDL